MHAEISFPPSCNDSILNCETAAKLNLKELSMGMSADYENALLCNSTFLRIGTLIMGDRKTI